jgi:hypothetical protein
VPDAASNGNVAAAPLSITYAQPVTAAPVINNPANSSRLNTLTPTCSGTAPAASTATVYVDNASISTTTATGNVLTNDMGTNPRAVLINRPANGTLVLNPDGFFSYQPATGFTGLDTFTYYACNMGAPLVCGYPATESITVPPATNTRVGRQPARRPSQQPCARRDSR